MNLIMKFIAIFVPVRDNAFSRPLLWETPIRFFIPNAIVMGAALAVHFTSTGLTAFWSMALAAIFGPMVCASLLAAVLSRVGISYRGE